MDDFTGRRAAKPYGRWSADTERAFLLALRLTGRARLAAEEIGRSTAAAYARRKRFPDFARAWDAEVARQQAEWVATQRARWGGDPGAPEDDDDGVRGERLAGWRERADGWTAAGRRSFLAALERDKDVRAACRAAGVSSTSAYYLRGRSPAFARAWEQALRGELPSVAGAAFARAVEGWDDPIVHGGQVVAQRRRYSDSLLRLLLQHELAMKAPEAPRAPRGAPVERPHRRALAVAPGGDLVRQAHNAARAAGGIFSNAATSAQTDAALMKKIAMVQRKADMEAEEQQAADWVRARRCWAEMGRAGLRVVEGPPAAGRLTRL